ncbi:hypothetical protein GUITHDRAFT_136953 [Guillardia theta CCMP2712]|uniref:Uncharacterized protein n=1 Tax=Guillardia theta (strain CCMP2712) TaxID=905079 RepID=L1JHI9_GUITC|nr:hypothetical protein GUITHDRAFT_136953 [Guillardia theta CCMP2712]EKX47988.1 hypothetical protein GUITHDRAFT_136953 [Guillardia theta CCMP2712]|eukprot:XP_005834968.1 hypothetical protein GUITHDRAFT_136953 [Guillardia theta CCMP2712]
MEVDSDFLTGSTNGIAVDASYSRKDWFMKQASRSSSQEGLTGEEAEEILVKGLDPSSPLLRGDPTEIASRMSAIISAANRMMSKERTKVEAMKREKEEQMHECKILKSKLKEMEKERNQLLRSNMEMKDKVRDEVMDEIIDERNEWQGKVNSLLEEIATLKARNLKLAAAEEELIALKESIASKEEQACESSFELQNANVRLDFVEKKLERIIQNVNEEFSTLKRQKDFFEAEVQTKDIREQAEAHLQSYEEKEEMQRRKESLEATINVLMRKNEQTREAMGKQRVEIEKLWEMIRLLKEKHAISEEELSRLHKRIFRAGGGQEDNHAGPRWAGERLEGPSKRSAVEASQVSRSLSDLSSDSIGIYKDPVSQWVRGLRADEGSRAGKLPGGKQRRSRKTEEATPRPQTNVSLSLLGSTSSGRHLSAPLQRIKQKQDEDVKRESLLGNEWDLIILERLWGRQIPPGSALVWDVFLDIFTPSMASQNAMKDAHNSSLSPSKDLVTKLWEMMVESDEPPLSVAWKTVMELIDGVKKLQTGNKEHEEEEEEEDSDDEWLWKISHDKSRTKMQAHTRKPQSSSSSRAGGRENNGAAHTTSSYPHRDLRGLLASQSAPTNPFASSIEVEDSDSSEEEESLVKEARLLILAEDDKLPIPPDVDVIPSSIDVPLAAKPSTNGRHDIQNAGTVSRKGNKNRRQKRQALWSDSDS